MAIELVNLKKEVENLELEMEKFNRGNKSAGTRARKVLQAVKKECQNIRNQIQDIKKAP